MANFTKVAKTSEIPAGSGKVVEVDGKMINRLAEFLERTLLPLRTRRDVASEYIVEIVPGVVIREREGKIPDVGIVDILCSRYAQIRWI